MHTKGAVTLTPVMQTSTTVTALLEYFNHRIGAMVTNLNKTAVMWQVQTHSKPTTHTHHYYHHHIHRAASNRAGSTLSLHRSLAYTLPHSTPPQGIAIDHMRSLFHAGQIPVLHSLTHAHLL